MSGLPSQHEQIAEAAALLRGGRLVAFPTETVYGLGADATNADAVSRIFAAKGRPSTNPLIVHVSGVVAAKRYAKRWPDAARKLGSLFWPGPLTLVLPKMPSIVPGATAGRDTVGLRVPDHPLALELLRAFDGPVAAPSANRSNHVSPTTAGHVRQELGSAVDLILDGGPCTVGIESTVLDLSTDHPTILRPGGVSREQIENVIGPVAVFNGTVSTTEAAVSPGQHERHYSPVTPTVRIDTADLPAGVERLIATGRRVTVLAIQKATKLPGSVRPMPTDAPAYARALYASLRDADALAVDVIVVEMPPDEPAWAAVRDRLRRATRPVKEMFP